MNVLITGGNGFLGSRLVEKFVNKGHSVTIIDLNKNPIEKKKHLKKIKFFNADITSLKSLNKVKVKQNSILLHCAGQPSAALSFKDPIGDLEKNVLGMVNILKFAKIKNIKKIIFASTFNVYKENSRQSKLNEKSECQPKSLYAVSKLAAENYLKVYAPHLNIKWNIIRMFNIYGPGQDPNNPNLGMISIFLNMAKNSSKIIVKGSLKRFRDFVYIDDVVDGWYKIALSQTCYNKIYNLGSGVKTNLNQLFKVISNTLKKKIEIKEEQGTPGDFLGCYANINKIKRELNFRPKFKLARGVLIFYNWLKNIKKI